MNTTMLRVLFFSSALGCHRIIVNYGYLESLGKPNLSLNYDGISEITEKGVVTKTGK